MSRMFYLYHMVNPDSRQVYIKWIVPGTLFKDRYVERPLEDQAYLYTGYGALCPDRGDYSRVGTSDLDRARGVFSQLPKKDLPPRNNGEMLM
jgi:hypothetical protein